jgi:hypothetical protein
LPITAAEAEVDEDDDEEDDEEDEAADDGPDGTAAELARCERRLRSSARVTATGVSSSAQVKVKACGKIQQDSSKKNEKNGENIVLMMQSQT